MSTAQIVCGVLRCIVWAVAILIISTGDIASSADQLLSGHRPSAIQSTELATHALVRIASTFAIAFALDHCLRW